MTRQSAIRYNTSVTIYLYNNMSYLYIVQLLGIKRMYLFFIIQFYL